MVRRRRSESQFARGSKPEELRKHLLSKKGFSSVVRVLGFQEALGNLVRIHFFPRRVRNLDGPIRANRFADSRESPEAS